MWALEGTTVADAPPPVPPPPTPTFPAAAPIDDPPGEMEPEDMEPVVWDLRRDKPPVEEREVNDVTDELSVVGGKGVGISRMDEREGMKERRKEVR